MYHEDTLRYPCLCVCSVKVILPDSTFHLLCPTPTLLLHLKIGYSKIKMRARLGAAVALRLLWGSSQNRAG